MPDTQDTTSPLPATESEKSLTIQSEEQFHEKIEAARVQKSEKNNESRFEELTSALHTKLKEQDSESALALITRGALGLGSSDIHYDTRSQDISVRIRIDGELVTITHLER
jgi:type II secretory ATPase GspE/PulE/Tfp pilus assembly ATPase PilB-like protein